MSKRLIVIKDRRVTRIEFRISAKEYYILCQSSNTTLHLVYEVENSNFFDEWEAISQVLGESVSKSDKCIFIRLSDFEGEIQII